jgi:RHS repeat-associated protein
VAITRDALGRIATRKETIAGISTNDAYTYDSRGRLTKVTRGAAVIGSYDYDANDNRMSATDSKGTRSATHDTQDRLLTDGTASFTYTPEGALLTKTSGSETTTCDYDLLGALRGVTLPNGTRIDYLVDGTHRRIGKKVNGSLTKAFLYQNTLPTVSATAPPFPSGTQVVAEFDATGALVSRFLYGSKPHVPDAVLRSGKTYRLFSDERGSVRLVIDAASGAVAQRIDYDAWGNVMSDTSPGFQPFGFGGGLYDPDTGLVRFGARDYDAGKGRWLEKDPDWFVDSSNRYLYTLNDPVNQIDPNGRFVLVGCLAGGAAGAFGGGIASIGAQALANGARGAAGSPPSWSWGKVAAGAGFGAISGCVTGSGIGFLGPAAAAAAAFENPLSWVGGAVGGLSSVFDSDTKECP